MPADAEWTLTARWIFPVAAPPLANGTVTVRGEHIVAVQPKGERSADIDFGNAAVLPGLVNAHTHLDLTGLRGRCPPSADFTGWLRAVIAHRHRQHLRTDRVGHPHRHRGMPALRNDPGRRHFQPGSKLAPACRGAAARGGVPRAAWLDGAARRRGEGERARLAGRAATDGDVPGRPESSCAYSVRKTLFAQVGRQSRTGDIPVAVHLAETHMELELLRHRAGHSSISFASWGCGSPTAWQRRLKNSWTVSATLHGCFGSMGTILIPTCHCRRGTPSSTARALTRLSDIRGIRSRISWHAGCL